MAFNANLGTQSFQEKQVVTGTHPAVVRPMKALANQGSLEAGLVVAKDSSGLVVPYDPQGTAPVNDPVGVLISKVDTSVETVVRVLVHGTVVKESLLVGSNPASDSDVQALEAKGIWAE